MADVSATDIQSVLVAVDQLKLGAMVFLTLLAVLGVVCFYLWLRNKKEERNVALRTAALEQEKKDARGKEFTSTLQNLTQAFTNHDKWESERLKDMQSSMETTKITSSQTLTRTFAMLQETLQEILDRQRGMINTGDSLRIIEQTFERIILTEFARVCDNSIRKNDYASRAAFVKEKVTLALLNIIDGAIKNLKSYEMTLDVSLFFPITTPSGITYPGRSNSDKGEFLLVQNAWDVVRVIHEGKVGHKEEDKNKAVELCTAQLGKLISQSFQTGKILALDIYGNRH
jgi:hypothetical protein